MHDPSAEEPEEPSEPGLPPESPSAAAVRELVARCLLEMDREGDTALERLCAEHPEHASSLRERIERLRDMGLVGAGGELEGVRGELGSTGVPRRIGDFVLIRELGAGGMGVVHLAEQCSLERKVALKLVRPDRVMFDAARERFLREIRTIARLQHPSIVQVFAAGEENGVPYFAMEYLDGASLDRVVATQTGRNADECTGSDLFRIVHRQPLDETPVSAEIVAWFSRSWTEMVLRIVLQVAEALVHAHARGVLHRDVKPSNVMVTRDCRVQLLDFGLALPEDSLRLTASGAPLGSLPYMSPEQIRCEKVDARADVYALGVTLYELLTFRSPYLGANAEETRQKVLAGAALEPRHWNRSIPVDVQTVCRKAMDVAPGQRYPTMREFAEDLRSLLELRPIQATPLRLPLRLRRLAQRHPAGSAATAIATLALLVGVPLFLWREWQYREQIRAERDEAQAARVVAEAQTARATAVMGFQRRMFRAVDPGEDGRDVRVADVLDVAAFDLEHAFPGQPDVEASVHLALGETYASLSLYEAADQHLSRARELLLASPRTTDRDRADVDLELARLRLSQGRTEDAEPLLAQAREGFVRAGGTDSAKVENVDLERATLLRIQGRIVEARDLAEQACQRTEALLGPTAQETLDAFGQFGSLLYLAGELPRAEEVLRETVQRKETFYQTPDAPSVLVTRLNLASVLYAQNRFQEAHDEAIAVSRTAERLLGPEHSHTLTALALAASALGGLGDLRGEEELERSLWTRRSKVLGADHPDTLRTAGNLADTMQRLGQSGPAEELARQVLEARRRVLGEEHWETAQSYNQVSAFVQRRGDEEEAEEMLAKAVAGGRASLGDAHWIVGAFLSNQGRCLVALKRYDDAEDVLLEAHELLTAQFGEDNPRVQGCVKSLVRLYEERGDEAECERWRAKLTGQ